jgi:BirA family biotin operon repressor/biotin-[acetyl-CoA-carboxylase] ligase
MSVLMRLRMPPTQAASVTLGAAVGVREALEQVCGVQAQVKWPNDLYVGDGKLCGILVEGVVGSSGGIEAAVVGIGVNVNMVEAQVHEELRGAVTSVRMVTGREHDRGALVVAMRRRVVEQIEQVVEHGLGQIMARLRAWDKLDGEPVEFFLDAANGWRAGTGRGLDDQGRLIVEDEAGAQHELCAGEVRWTRRR